MQYIGQENDPLGEMASRLIGNAGKLFAISPE
jgi:hypothetical protein